MKLTNVQIKNAQSKDKPYKLSDGKGLYLLVNANSSKYWRLAYRFEGKQKLLALGVYPEVSLAEARTKQEEARQLIKKGLDPIQEKQQRQFLQLKNQANSFEAIACEWVEAKKSTWSTNCSL